MVQADVKPALWAAQRKEEPLREHMFSQNISWAACSVVQHMCSLGTWHVKTDLREEADACQIRHEIHDKIGSIVVTAKPLSCQQ